MIYHLDLQCHPDQAKPEKDLKLPEILRYTQNDSFYSLSEQRELKDYL
jgi:hypothetical protein